MLLQDSLAQSALSKSKLQLKGSELCVTVPCKLEWRERKLVVSRTSDLGYVPLEALLDSGRLIGCLERSLVKEVKLDPALGTSGLIEWAEACQKAKKACSLSSSILPELLNHQKLSGSFFQNILKPKTAFLIMILLAPISMMMAGLMKYCNWELDRQWAIGRKGYLFQILHLRDTSINKGNANREKLSTFFNAQLPKMLEVSLLY